jgi:hypothetical protein
MNDIILHFKRPATWANIPNVFYWNTTPAIPAIVWPGFAMLDEGTGWWRYTIKNTLCSNIIFNNNTAPQTADLLNVCGEKWYDNGFVNPPVARGTQPAAIQLNQKYRVYPNPVSKELSISFGLTKSTKVSTILYDITGRIVYKSNPQIFQTGVQNITIRRNAISRGTYVIETRIGDTIQRNTLVFE